ncbi:MULTISPECIES: CIA30 family protein [unclassified Shewanella]|nr:MULTISPECIES: CIA30 family protein [unclassified Shewanella]
MLKTIRKFRFNATEGLRKTSNNQVLRLFLAARPHTLIVILTMGLTLGLTMTTSYQANAAEQAISFDVTAPTIWRTVNDTVMGGISQSTVTANATSATFSGELSLERNGGFASTRTPMTQAVPATHNLIRIAVKGDGRQYQLRIRTDEQWDSYAYSKPFNTENNQWLQLVFKAKDFTPVYRGREVDAPALNFSQIKQIGFLLADKQSGAFELTFKNIDFIANASEQ